MPEDSVLQGSEESVDQNLESAQADLEATATETPETPETETPASATQTTTTDWESRFKGLQGTLQQKIEYARALEQQLQQYREAELRQQVAHLPEEQQNWYIGQFQKEQEIARREAEIQQQAQLVDMAARQLAVTKLAQQYGVSAEILNALPDLKSMQLVGETLSKQRRAERKAERKAKGANNFEGSTHVSAPPKKFKSVDEASDYFANLPIPTRD